MYALKKVFMTKMIQKKQAKKPFDYEAGENYRLPADADNTVNNSYYFSAHDPISGISFYVRLGGRNCHSEVWFYFADGENSYVLTEMLYKENAPLKVCRVEKGWQVEYSGDALDKSGKRVKVELKGLFVSSETAIDFFSHMPAVRTATAMAQEKWNKTFFNEVQKNNQVHYEQLGRFEFKIVIDGKPAEYALPCVRDHSFGKRDWNYMNNHLWLMAVSSNEQLNFSMVSYPAMSILEVGNFKAADKMKFIVKADYDRNVVAKGVNPDNLSLVLTLDDGATLEVKIEKTDEQTYLFQDGEYRLIEGIANFTINGKDFRGILEIGFNGNKERWFNGKSIQKLKV